MLLSILLYAHRPCALASVHLMEANSMFLKSHVIHILVRMYVGRLTSDIYLVFLSSCSLVYCALTGEAIDRAKRLFEEEYLLSLQNRQE